MKKYIDFFLVALIFFGVGFGVGIYSENDKRKNEETSVREWCGRYKNALPPTTTRDPWWQYQKVPSDECTIVARTWPSFDYIIYQAQFFEAVPQIGGKHSLSFKFKNRKEMMEKIKQFEICPGGLDFYQNGYFIVSRPDLYNKPCRFEGIGDNERIK